ncbi:hypothetical protein BV898_17887 [Hypsibius exemplaris]|uniref:Uncharacterized protein n=1 Tax=Hypsibius exemplaris TaxID=2072580 RepID=A0A9X6NHR8_HYPEX|nr:hypothetical protein BV898_17887 [Hypsibius exemplaris]
MVTIDATKIFLGPLFIVMQKITGYQFSPQVQQDLFVAPDILTAFVRKTWDWVVRDNIQWELQQRNSILKLQLLVHNQFSSP